MKKILAVLLALTFVVCAFASCGSKPAPEEPAAEETTVEETTVEETTAAPEETTVEETAAEETTADPNKLPETKEEILAAYTEVLNAAKAAKPSFNKIEYQKLPSDSGSRVVAKGETLVNAALKLADNFMTTEADAEEQYKEKGSDMHAFPVYDNDTYGCMLSDASFLKNATCEKLDNGNYKIVLTLNNENNPEPPKNASVSPSKTGAVVGTISKADIDKELNGGLVSAVFSQITYSLTYHDCTSTVEYNPETLQVVSITQITNVSIQGYAKAGLIVLDITRQELINTCKIYNVKY